MLKTRDFDENVKNDEFAFDPQHKGLLLNRNPPPRPRTMKITKLAVSLGAHSTDNGGFETLKGLEYQYFVIFLEVRIASILCEILTFRQFLPLWTQ